MAGLRRFIVKASSWQIFFIFLGTILIYGITPEENESLKIATSILLAVVFFGWFLLLGTSLNDNLPETQQKSDTLFILSCFYGVLAVSVSAILKDVQVDEQMMALAMVLVISFGLSSFYVIYFASVLFGSNQERLMEKEKLSPELIFILFVGFIFGILLLQSRIKKMFYIT